MISPATRSIGRRFNTPVENLIISRSRGFLATCVTEIIHFCWSQHHPRKRLRQAIPR